MMATEMADAEYLRSGTRDCAFACSKKANIELDRQVITFLYLGK
jgi:hypothetical protein